MLVEQFSKRPLAFFLPDNRSRAQQEGRLCKSKTLRSFAIPLFICNPTFLYQLIPAFSRK